MKMLNEKARKGIFVFCILISFGAVFIYNVLTPLMSDELLDNPSMFGSFWDILVNEYENYMTWNGRSVVQIIMSCTVLIPKWVFNICNSACFVFLTLLMYWNIERRKKYDFILFGLINLLVWQYGIEFGQTILWKDGACNYLWGSTIILAAVTFYRYKLEHQEQIRYPRLLAVGMFLICLLGGWCNENTSGGGLLLLLFLFGYYYYKNRKIKPWMISGIVGMATGLAFMVLAPGNRERAKLMQESHQGIMLYLSRFLKINGVVYHYLFVMLVITVVLLVYHFLKKHTIEQMRNAVAFGFVSMATCYALLFAPSPMERACFGAGIFLTVACVQAIAYISVEDVVMGTAKYAGFWCLLIFMFFSYFENVADLMRIMRELDAREAYVMEQKEQGKYDVTVPMIDPQFDNKYTFIYENDVNTEDDTNQWGSTLYKIYYGVDSLTGVPREEWTEY